LSKNDTTVCKGNKKTNLDKRRQQQPIAKAKQQQKNLQQNTKSSEKFLIVNFKPKPTFQEYGRVVFSFFLGELLPPSQSLI